MNKAINNTCYYLFAAALIFFLCVNCKNNTGSDAVHTSQSKIKVTAVHSDKGSYHINETVKLTYTFENNSAETATIKNVVIQLRDISRKTSPVIYEKKLESSITILPNEKYTTADTSILTIPAGALATVYGIYVGYEPEGRDRHNTYKSFFRVTNSSDFTTYNIGHSSYQGLDVYTLHGGMSAECVVQKAAENLKPGISHSWFVNAPGSGPEHVLATPQFLQNAVKEIVDFYNRSLGADTPFETVIIGPGLLTTPYLSRAMKAPMLPMHFLASCSTAKEIQTVLDYSNSNGYPSYATLGHDPSVPFAVSWVKLLDMPEEYLQFLRQHHVKNLVIIGYAGNEGENTAKKVNNDAIRSNFEEGSLFILYPGGGSAKDITELNSKIADFEFTEQQTNFINIADWESGIIEEQVDNFIHAARTKAGVRDTRYITSQRMISLWDFATYVSAAFIHKNIAAFSANGQQPVKGVSINPYMVANSFFESYTHYLPFIYWQLNPPASTIERMNRVMDNVKTAYFPQMQPAALSYWINSSNNFGGGAAASQLKGLLQSGGRGNIRENDYGIDDVWNPADGMDAPVEKRAEELINSGVSSASLKVWNDGLQILTMEDLDEMGRRFADIIVR